MSMQKRPGENRSHPNPSEPVPDLTDFMNDWFFGSVNTERSNTYNLTGGSFRSHDYDDEEEEERFGRNNNSKLTNEWLEEAKRLVASSPSRHDSPSRLVGSPRFVAAQGRELASVLDRRDPLSRSARRHKAAEGFSGEILSKSAKHNRNKSETVEPTPEKSPASVVHQWFSNILRTNTPDGQPRPEPPEKRDDGQNPAVQPKPPRQPVRRKSRFQDNPSDTRKALTAIPVSRTFRNPASEPENQVLSPPKNLVESTHRRSISSSTCSRERLSWADVDSRSKQVEGSNCKQHVGRLNGFLKEQRAKLGRISRGESSAKAKIILSGASTSTSSIVAAICYAWLLENKEKKEKEEGEGWWVVVPVINMKRRRMWKQKQAAWLLHHVGIDCSALLFSNEVDLESLLTARQLTILVIGQDVLKTNGEVGSQCTILTDNYCEDAYELLQTPYLKELLLAGILLDTQNLNITDKLSTNRDTEAVQLLLVGSSLNDSYVLFDQLMDEHVDNAFLEAMQQNYGKRSVDTDDENGRPHEQRLSVRKSTSSSYQEINDQTSDLTPSDVKIVKARVVPPKSAKQKPSPAPTPVPTPTPKPAPEPASRGKNKFSIAKWFGFGSK